MGRYSNIPIIKDKKGNSVMRTVKYPIIPFEDDDIYLLTEFGDRLEILSLQYYNRVDLYWIIRQANLQVLKGDSIFLPPGVQIRVPTNINSIISNYKQLNNL